MGIGLGKRNELWTCYTPSIPSDKWTNEPTTFIPSIFTFMVKYDIMQINDVI